MFNDKVILITGGTGSFGKKCTEIILKNYKPKKFIIFSRDELKQWEMRQVFNEKDYPCMRYFIGDIRNKDRLYRGFYGVDFVIHAAALKQVPALEYNPFEAVETNIIGAQNIIDAAIDRGVKKVIFVSTDKAVNPINLYGATKLCAEKLFVAGNSYAGGRTKFSVVRYGNVVGSRGSVIPFFLKYKQNGSLPITDVRMTRFWITLEQGVNFVLSCLEKMQGGEIFVPKIPSMKIMDLAKAICPECKLEITGIRPGEKINEVLVSKDEARRTVDVGNFFIIQPNFPFWDYKNWENGTPLPDEYEYTSDNNDRWLSIDELQEMIKHIKIE
ncbi:MAG: UDP-N-acetylglucosamine 4,6-dehydratase (inverting) [Thermodesulfobacteriota bacterium]|nr:MAG: UDP-N-acetylglucosamine 4,6-dehydratase (inverting) [Thermodesulfobacteriota bacterium]